MTSDGLLEHLAWVRSYLQRHLDDAAQAPDDYHPPGSPEFEEFAAEVLWTELAPFLALPGVPTRPSSRIPELPFTGVRGVWRIRPKGAAKPSVLHISDATTLPTDLPSPYPKTRKPRAKVERAPLRLDAPTTPPPDLYGSYLDTPPKINRRSKAVPVPLGDGSARIPINGRYADQIVLIDEADIPLVTPYTWCLFNAKGGLSVKTHLPKTRTRAKSVTIPLQRMILNPPEGKYVKFVDGNALNCRRANLYVVDRSGS